MVQIGERRAHPASAEVARCRTLDGPLDVSVKERMESGHSARTIRSRADDRARWPSLCVTTCSFMWGKQRLAFDSSAPAEWATGGSAAARLYCRLLAAVQAADASVALARADQVATDQLDAALRDLRRQAIAITEHLVVVSRLPVVKRQQALRPLRSPVDEVERLAVRIGRSAAD